MTAENCDTLSPGGVRAEKENVNDGSPAQELDQSQITELIRRAQEMLLYSYSPYSGFAVGAALMCADGRIYTGCNIENAAFGPSVCAERTAFFKAVSEGERAFKAIAIMGGKDRNPNGFCPPCGVCRQVMREFCSTDSFRVILAADTDRYIVRTLEELLPESFGPDNI